MRLLLRRLMLSSPSSSRQHTWISLLYYFLRSGQWEKAYTYYNNQCNASDCLMEDELRLLLQTHRERGEWREALHLSLAHPSAWAHTLGQLTLFWPNLTVSSPTFTLPWIAPFLKLCSFAQDWKTAVSLYPTHASMGDLQRGLRLHPGLWLASLMLALRYVLEHTPPRTQRWTASLLFYRERWRFGAGLAKNIRMSFFWKQLENRQLDPAFYGLRLLLLQDQDRGGKVNLVSGKKNVLTFGPDTHWQTAFSVLASPPAPPPPWIWGL